MFLGEPFLLGECRFMIAALDGTSGNTYTMVVSPTLQVRGYMTQYLHHGCVSNSPG